MTSNAVPLGEQQPGDRARDAVAANLRRHRLRRGLSLRELAEVSGSSKGLLSQIERGVANPTLDVLGRLAAALDLTVADLIRSHLAEPEVIRSDGEALPVDEIEVRTLFTTFERRRTELSESRLPAGVQSARSEHGRGSVECAFVLDGSVTVSSQGWSIELGTGDAIQFSAEHPHTYTAAPGGAQLLTLVGFTDD